ncbi:ATP-binding protein [Rathayibacter rathayi]|uniref:Uncharacterized protein n=1 Tax=Rathayibacter rathayi TaxID=33887 RepID=A0ABD6W6E3_RATRA|nr:ATP-binding protein [Rathayibacter rathayi]MWV75863.1 hypothetical protein [Rathayibacter rathayi NCPPB 2980 = VKM Ac-1601]PPF11950.1 hypothetical protein C5C04_11475 [Rathayibacter rathayi]PPF45189.1 hypothetical protein C5C08_12605 [Rathayibacter rathayi]PPF77702.1 hypothetical protein C5C14_12035 [Rathayibacter rathayi]PPG11567.1 hypothetical protein C5C11_12170 [Rathayibacter rathayi]
MIGKAFFDRYGSLIGLNPSRTAPPPVYRIITDGLTVTSTGAEAWFALGTSNADVMDEDGIDREIAQIVSNAGTVLKDKWCHLKIIWSWHSGAEYESSMADYYSAGDWRRWLADRAEYIDEVRPPRRVLLLGVSLRDDHGHDTTELERFAAPLTGVEWHRVPKKDFLQYRAQVNKLARQLGKTNLQASIAPVELLAWSISREQYDQAPPVPDSRLITGGLVRELTAGRIQPAPDHLKVFTPEGNVGSYRAVLPVAAFPQEIQVPGDGSWLWDLASITMTTDEGDEVAVMPEASIRFQIMSKKESKKLAEQARTQAKEQRISAAKHNAGEPSDEITETEDVAGQLTKEINRAGTLLVRQHPRFIVRGSTVDEIRRKRDAVTSYFADASITITSGVDEQKELYLEQFPGDRLRVEDLGTVTDGTGFFASLFWGGSQLSETRGPCLGVIKGATSGLARFDITGLATRGMSTTVGIFGNSGQGKTTLMELLTLEAVFGGGWGLLWDWKGDTKGVSLVAAEYGLASQVIRFGLEHSGAADQFHILPLGRNTDGGVSAETAVAGLIVLLGGQQFRGISETAALSAAQEVGASRRPSTWRVVQLLARHEDPDVRKLGEFLVDIAKTPMGAVILGEPKGDAPLRPDPGLWVVQMPGLRPPRDGSTPDSWGMADRLSMAAMRAIATFLMHMSGAEELRGLPKVIAIPEMHYQLAIPDGAFFLEDIARTGRALHTVLLLDSQDVSRTAEISGLAEQLVAVFGFNARTTKEQDAMTDTLNLPPGSWSRSLIAELGPPVRGTDRNLKGDCYYRDMGRDVAHIQVDLPNERVRELLDTSPKATAKREDAA